MYVPVISRKNVINQTIIYSDTVLSLNELGDNIKISTIYDVKEFELESCLKIIFESNPDVIFNTIQYSQANKKVYFYTNKEISSKSWENSKITKYKPLASPKLLLEELKNVLTLEKNKSPEVISLFDLCNLIKKNYISYERIINYFEQNLTRIAALNFYYRSSIRFDKFDYKKRELKISFDYYNNGVWRNYSFSKFNDDLYISNSSGGYSDEILLVLGNELSKFYDKLMEFSSFNKEFIHDKLLIDTKFTIDTISMYGVDIEYRLPDYSTIFHLRKYSYEDKYNYRCNSNNVINAFNGQEVELFKRLFIDIKNCPKWSQNELYEIRKKQLEEEKRIEEEIRKKEIRAQKKLALKRKIFPFLYK